MIRPRTAFGKPFLCMGVCLNLGLITLRRNLSKASPTSSASMSLFASPRLSSKKVPTLTGRCLAAHLRDLFAERLAFFHACFALILRFRRHEQKAIFQGKACRGTIISR